MIGKVSGRLDHRGDDHVLIYTGGVGYLVYCSDRTLAAMPAPGGAVALYTELVVREDLMQLFGFRTLAEREWHRLLVTVQGVGAKAALAILGTLGPEGVARALSLGDVSAIRAAPGVGPKLAQRVALELRAKAPAVMAMGAAGAEPAMVSGRPETLPELAPAAAPLPPMASPQAAAGDAQARADALSALVNLGYGEGEAAAAVAGVEAGDAAATIRAALRALAPKG
jgi:Holliday junction DNA helicase RuvA